MAGTGKKNMCKKRGEYRIGVLNELLYFPFMGLVLHFVTDYDCIRTAGAVGC